MMHSLHVTLLLHSDYEKKLKESAHTHLYSAAHLQFSYIGDGASMNRTITCSSRMESLEGLVSSMDLIQAFKTGVDGGSRNRTFAKTSYDLGSTCSDQEPP